MYEEAQGFRPVPRTCATLPRVAASVRKLESVLAMFWVFMPGATRAAAATSADHALDPGCRAEKFNDQNPPSYQLDPQMELK